MLIASVFWNSFVVGAKITPHHYEVDYINSVPILDANLLNHSITEAENKQKDEISEYELYDYDDSEHQYIDFDENEWSNEYHEPIETDLYVDDDPATSKEAVEENGDNSGVYFDDEELDTFTLNESERVAEHHQKGYQWPIPDEMYSPKSPGWLNLMKRRFQQIERIQDDQDRYNAYYQNIIAAHLISNFTEHGFGLTRCMDEELMNELRQAIYDGIDTAPLESDEPIIPGPNPPLFIDRGDLMIKVVSKLQNYAETWSGIELKPYGAYGLRIYRNESELLMHTDRAHTHIISFIMHVASSNDSVLWPIFIEDFHGNTHEVNLTSGDILFYESSKLLHGRPKPFHGSWYCSVFVHYYPKYPTYNWHPDMNQRREAHIAVPPSWTKEYQDENATESDDLTKVVMVETAFKEPDCPYQWCGTMKTIQWSGPGEDNVLITPTKERLPFYPSKPDTMVGDHDEL